MDRKIKLRTILSGQIAASAGSFKISLVVLFVFAASVLTINMLDISHWRHDELSYLPREALVYKTLEEGRWLNLLLFDVYELVSPKLAVLLNVLFIGGGIYVVSRSAVPDPYVSAIVALAALTYPGLFEQLTWPVAILPGSIIFFLGSITTDRLGWWAVLPFGVLLFATIPYFYLILSLMMLRGETANSLNSAIRIVLRGIYWSIGLALGYLAAAYSNLLISGTFGIELAEWRNPNPARDIGDVLENAMMYASIFVSQISAWLPKWSIFILVSVLVLSVLLACRSRNIWDLIVRLGFAFVLTFSPYLILLGSGIIIQFRSLLPLVAGLLLAPALLLPDRHRLVISSALALAIAIPSATSSYRGIQWFSAFTETNVRNIQTALPRLAPSYDKIVLDVPDADGYAAGVQAQLKPSLRLQFFQEGFSEATRVAPALNELGFQNIVICQYTPDDDCLRLETLVQEGACKAEFDQVCIVDVEAGTILIRLLP